MPHTLKQPVRVATPKRRVADPARLVWTGPPRPNQPFVFLVADLVFLVLVGIAATLTMYCVHKLGWPFVPTSLLGMMAAMLVQALMAFAAAPLLGSIESMVPSMIVAMVSPMTLCVLHLVGCESSWTLSAAIGSAFAIGTFILIQRYARCCRHALNRRTDHKQG